MDITITGRHLNLHPKIQAFVHAKFEKLNRFFDRLHGGNVIIDQDGRMNRVEFTVGAGKGVVFSSHAEADDLEAAISMAESKVEAQIRKYKERLQDRRNRHHEDSTPNDLGAEPRS